MLYALETDSRGVLLLGAAGIGKTSLLRILEGALDDRGSAAFYVSLQGLRDPGELASRVVDAIEASRFEDAIAGERTIRSSAGAPSLDETAEVLREAGLRLESPVLLIDGLDEAAYPLRAAAAVEQLSELLDDWKFVVASRRTSIGGLGRSGQFRVIKLGPLDNTEARALLEARAPSLTDGSLREITDLAGGNPLFLKLLADVMGGDPSLVVMPQRSIDDLLPSLVSQVIEMSPEGAQVAALVDQLAVVGGRDRIASLAATLRRPAEDVQALLEQSPLVTIDATDGTAALVHERVREAILARRILALPFTLSELKFGSEAAEKDDLLDTSYIGRTSLTAILDQRYTIVVGDRGSGKSAIFRKLLERGERADESGLALCPISDPADLLHRVIDKDSELDAETLKAAWLVVIASVIASAIPASAPRMLRRTASALTAAFGSEGEKTRRGQRLLRAIARPFAGTTLKLAVGPANLEAKLPAGSAKPAGTTLDVEAFLQQADEYFRGSGGHAVALLDRIDETFKYDRKRQEALVQGLFLAEGRISLLTNVGLVLFLRTDLFELYDIQEKTKLVSRTLTLEWSEEDWLRLLTNRALVNTQLQGLAETLNYWDGSSEIRRPLEAIFPPQVEGQPIERWLIDSLKNGNGDVSPRSAVLMLHLAREKSPDSDARVETLPLFSADAAALAMTRISELAVSEVVDDFKVACTFVRNCRAGKLETFPLSDVEPLFDPSEGTISAQVAMLERLGFLARTVMQDDSGAKSRFRIPKLYTRCWDSA